MIDQHFLSQPKETPFNAAITEIGFQLLSTSEHGYILPFEVVSMLLLAAMIGCIVIAMKNNSGNLEKPEPPGSKLMIHSDFISPQNQEEQI
jgi:hypothetical protein